MNEVAAREWLQRELDVPRETLDRLEVFTHLLVEENERQNLIAHDTIPILWTRHIVDSAQLLLQVPAPDASWVDLGTGAGFPGLIVAILHPGQVTLVEERKKRVEFLQRAIEKLGLDHVQLIGKRVELVEPRSFDVISARAFAPLDRLLALGERFAADETLWVLPKGRNAKSELEAIHGSWQGEFRLVPSLTDADAAIIVAERVRRRGKGKKAR